MSIRVRLQTEVAQSIAIVTVIPIRTVATATTHALLGIPVVATDAAVTDVDRIEKEPNQSPQRNAGNRPFCGSALSSAWLI